MHPSIDFLGLILLNLCFPNLLPTKYAHVSVPHAAINTYHIMYLPNCAPYNKGKKAVKSTI